MNQGKTTFSVFTKPWQVPLPELGQIVSNLGFAGIELPVRPEYQVEPENVEDLPRAAQILSDFGVKICSIAGPTDERTIAACAQAAVPIIRICVEIGEEGYLATEPRVQKAFDALVPLLEQYGVQIGIQNHCGHCIGSARGLRHLIEKYDPQHFAAVWDPAHCALDGEEPDLAVDILWSHLCMVNLKNAFWRRTNGPEAEYAKWESYWTTGRHGLASWPRVVEVLKQRDWHGVVCLCAEYSDAGTLDRSIANDLAFAKSLFT